MAIRANGGFNNEALGAAAENIAKMFGPPSGSDLAAYSVASKNRQEVEHKARLAEMALDPSTDLQMLDRAGLGFGGWLPTQSFRKVDLDDATTRRGQDVDATTMRANNADTNRTSLISNMFGALNEGQVRPAVPGDIASSFDLPELPQVAGMPKPLSQDQVLARETQRLIDGGGISDDMLTAMSLGTTPVENIVGPDGQPVVAYRNDAVGQTPYFNQGAEAKPTNGVALLPDGRRVPARQNSDGSWVHAQTNEVLPDDIQLFNMPQAQGSAEDVGMVSKPTGAQIEQQIIDIAIAKDTAVALRDKIAASPASQGAVGWLRGTAQNFIQTGGELGEYFGGDIQAVQQRIAEGLEDQSLAGAFDTNIPAIELLSNLLAFQYAKTTTGERLSNEMLQNTRKALGLDGLTANQASSLARLDQAIAQIESQEGILRDVREGGVDAIGSGRRAPPAASAPAAGGAPTPTTQAEFDALLPGAVYIDPDDGQQYRKP